MYQAYSADIATAALRSHTFVEPFKRCRMTWIKPSFLWMMYRSGWAEKSGQNHILAIKISRSGFEWALRNSCLSQYEAGVYTSNDAWAERKSKSPVRIQWDPERSLTLAALPWRTIQVGLSNEAIDLYTESWIVDITDHTRRAHQVRELVDNGDTDAALEHIEAERAYPIPDDIAGSIGLAR